MMAERPPFSRQYQLPVSAAMGAGVAFQRGGDGLGDGLAGAIDAEQIFAGRIDLEKHMLALGGQAEIDSAETQLHLLHHLQKLLADLVGQIIGRDRGAADAAAVIHFVFRGRAKAGGEDLAIDHRHPQVQRQRDIFLKDHRRETHGVDLAQLLGADLQRGARRLLDIAEGLADDAGCGMALDEGAGLVGAVGDQRFGDAQPDAAGQPVLIDLFQRAFVSLHWLCPTD